MDAGHLAFTSRDVPAKVAELTAAGFTLEASPDEVTIPGTVVVCDPDGYRVELLPQGSA